MSSKHKSNAITNFFIKVPRTPSVATFIAEQSNGNVVATTSTHPETSIPHHAKISSVPLSNQTIQLQSCLETITESEVPCDTASPPHKKKKRNGSYREDHVWLTDDNYCTFCKAYYSERTFPRGSDGTFITKPFTNFSKATGVLPKHNKLLKHEQSEGHRKAKGLIACSDQSQRNGSVLEQMYVASESEREENFSRLADYMKATYWLVKEEIPHTTKYTSLVNLCCELDGSRRMDMWRSIQPENATYNSHNTCAEFLTAIKEYMTMSLKDRVKPINMAVSYISVMADEATDLCRRTVLSVCLRYLNSNGKPVECFVGLRELENTQAIAVKEGVVTILSGLEVEMNNVMWLSFDGASNMAGVRNGAQALLIREHSKEAVYVHCRSHVLQLVCVHAAQKYPDVKRMFSLLNSLWRLIYDSPKNLRIFKDIQDILHGPDIDLVRNGNTRWTSHYRCISATIKCLNAIITTLQQLHADGADLSSEAGGILLTLQSRKGLLILYALKRILHPLCILAQQLQSPNATLANMQTYVSTTRATLMEVKENPDTFIAEVCEFLQTNSLALVSESSTTSDINVHNNIVKPYINCLLENMESRFSDKVMAMCTATTVFDPRMYASGSSNSSQVTEHLISYA